MTVARCSGGTVGGCDCGAGGAAEPGKNRSGTSASAAAPGPGALVGSALMRLASDKGVESAMPPELRGTWGQGAVAGGRAGPCAPGPCSGGGGRAASPACTGAKGARGAAGRFAAPSAGWSRRKGSARVTPVAPAAGCGTERLRREIPPFCKRGCGSIPEGDGSAACCASGGGAANNASAAVTCATGSCAGAVSSCGGGAASPRRSAGAASATGLAVCSSASSGPLVAVGSLWPAMGRLAAGKAPLTVVPRPFTFAPTVSPPAVSPPPVFPAAASPAGESLAGPSAAVPSLRCGAGAVLPAAPARVGCASAGGCAKNCKKSMRSAVSLASLPAGNAMRGGKAGLCSITVIVRPSCVAGPLWPGSDYRGNGLPVVYRTRTY